MRESNNDPFKKFSGTQQRKKNEKRKKTRSGRRRKQLRDIAKLFIFPCNCKNKNQNMFEISPFPVEITNINKTFLKTAGENSPKGERLFTIGCIANC